MAQNPVPPSRGSQLSEAKLPQEFRTLLSRLKLKYQSALRVTASDPEWLEVSVEGVPLAQLHAELQQQKGALLAGFSDRMQLIHPLRPDESGLYFHLLTAPSFVDRARLAAYGG